MVQYTYISIAIVVFLLSASIFWLHVVFRNLDYVNGYRYLDINFVNTIFFNIINVQLFLSLQLRVMSIGEVNFIMDPEAVVGIQLIVLIAFISYVLTFVFLDTRYSAQFRVNDYNVFYAGSSVAQLLYCAIIIVNYGLIAYGVVTLGFDRFFEYVGGRLYRDDIVFMILTITPVSLVACIMAIFKTYYFPRALFYVLAYGCAALMSGGRGAMVNAGIVMLALLVRFGRRPKFTTLIFGFFLPVALLFTLYTSYVRFATFEAQATSDVWFSDFLDSETFASWKSIYAVYDGGFRLPYPGYGFFSSLTFPIPRSIFEEKPLPPSTVFTMQISPVRFDNTGSEITLSGLGQFISEFGYVFGGFAFGIFVGILCSLQYVLKRSDRFQSAAVILLFYSLAAWRADVFTASRSIWIFIVLSVIGFGPNLYFRLLSTANRRNRYTNRD